jgi:hypothetical protein
MVRDAISIGGVHVLFDKLSKEQEKDLMKHP